MKTATFTKALFILLIIISGNCFAQGNLSADSVCAGSSGIHYSITGTPGSTFQWFVNGGTQVSGGTTDSITVNWSATPRTDTLKVVAYNVIGCPGDTVKLAVVRVAPPTVNITGTDSICINAATVASKLKMTFTGLAPWVVTYDEDGTTRNLTTSSSTYTFNSQVFTTAGVKPYSVLTVKDRLGCTGTKTGTANVTVMPKPSTSAIRRY